MEHRHNKLIAVLLLGVFAFFYCGNTLCFHTHILGDSVIVHSHPYLPSGHHSHSGQSLDSIAGFNGALSVMDTVNEPEWTAPYVTATLIVCKPVGGRIQLACVMQPWRAPPVA